MADYTYQKHDPTMTTTVIHNATGLTITGVVASPEELAVVNVPTALDVDQLSILDSYFNDLGYQRLFS